MPFKIIENKIVHQCIDCNRDLTDNDKVKLVLRTFEYLEYRCEQCVLKKKENCIL